MEPNPWKRIFLITVSVFTVIIVIGGFFIFKKIDFLNSQVVILTKRIQDDSSRVEQTSEVKTVTKTEGTSTSYDLSNYGFSIAIPNKHDFSTVNERSDGYTFYNGGQGEQSIIGAIIISLYSSSTNMSLPKLQEKLKSDPDLNKGSFKTISSEKISGIRVSQPTEWDGFDGTHESYYILTKKGVVLILRSTYDATGTEAIFNSIEKL
jgi:hypothetical protein